MSRGSRAGALLWVFRASPLRYHGFYFDFSRVASARGINDHDYRHGCGQRTGSRQLQVRN